MKKWNLGLGIALALMGLLMIIVPTFWVKFVVVVLGLCSIAYGIYSLTNTRKIYENTVYENTILIKSVAGIVVGAFAVILPLVFAETAFKAMSYILAIVLILSSAMGFYSVTLLKNSGVDRKRYILENFAVLVLGVLLFLIPSDTLGRFIVRLMGIVVLLIGAAFIFLEINAKKNEIVVEVSATEVKTEPAETKSETETVTEEKKTAKKSTKKAAEKDETSNS